MNIPGTTLEGHYTIDNYLFDMTQATPQCSVCNLAAHECPVLLQLGVLLRRLHHGMAMETDKKTRCVKPRCGKQAEQDYMPWPRIQHDEDDESHRGIAPDQAPRSFSAIEY